MVDILLLIELVRNIVTIILSIFTIIGTLFTIYQGIIHIWPEKEYIIRYKLTKPLKKFINRNLIISFLIYKSCIIQNNLENEYFFNEISFLFSNKENVLVSWDDDNIKIHFNENNFSFDYIISFEDYEYFDDFKHKEILIRQNSNIKFKDVFSFLNNSFWILRDIIELDVIKDESKKVEITLSSKKFTFFDNTLRVFGDIHGDNWNIYKSEDVSKISLNIPYNLNSIKKIIEIILLNLSNN